MSSGDHEHRPAPAPVRPFDGPDRLEVLPALGRAMRMGSPAALAAPDREALRALLERAAADAWPRLALFRGEAAGIVAFLLEWCLALPAALARLAGPDAERRVTGEALRRLAVRVEAIRAEGAARSEGAALALAALAPGRLVPDLAARYHADPGATHLPGALAGLEAARAALLAAETRGDPAAAQAALDVAWELHLGAHDVFVEFAQAHPEVTAELLGQPMAEAVLRTSFAATPQHDPLWALAGALAERPAELAAFLAEHLRSHFSGPGRGGGVAVVDEPDRIRLVFDPCGSGGALRRRHAARGRPVATLPAASAATWSRAGEVPAYCAHCALNELTSIERLGAPVLVTEFDPDPGRPCGWTVYKDPRRVPDERLARLGRGAGAGAGPGG